MKYYMHTLDGLPAAYMPEEKQICFLAHYGNRKSNVLATSLQQIKQMSDKLREEVKNHLDLCKRVGHDSKDTKLLQRCLSELEKSRWIPVEERLPEIGQQILAKHQYDNGDFFAVLVTYTVFGFPIAMWGESQVVTHWKPID